MASRDSGQGWPKVLLAHMALSLKGAPASRRLATKTSSLSISPVRTRQFAATCWETVVKHTSLRFCDGSGAPRGRGPTHSLHGCTELLCVLKVRPREQLAIRPIRKVRSEGVRGLLDGPSILTAGGEKARGLERKQGRFLHHVFLTGLVV